MILTVGMWAHLILTGMILYERTDNPIWGELRLIPSYIAVAFLWAVLASLI